MSRHPSRVYPSASPGCLLTFSVAIALVLSPLAAGAQSRVPAPPPAPAGARALPMPSTSRHLSGFQRRRAQGRGAFVDHTVLARSRGQRLSDLLRRLPGVSLVPLPGTGYAVATAVAGFQPGPGGAGMRSRVCFVDVLLDGVRLTPGSSAPLPLNIDEFAPSALAGLEFHRAPGIPLDFPVGSTSCGVLALWSER